MNATTIPGLRGAAIVAGCVLVLAGCESARFGGARGPAVAARTAPQPYDAPEPVVSAVPSGSVTSEPLPPLPGSTAPLSPATVASVPTMPGSPGPVETLGPAPTAATPPAAAGMSRSAAVGGWTAQEAAGSTCRVTLSSAPALDLYRASAPACANKDLSRVTAWDYRDGEIYLYQPGGSVAARLRGNAGSLAGVLAKSGAPLTLTR